MHLSIGEHTVEAREGLRRSGENDEATDRTVETMDDAEKDVARLLILLLDILAHEVCQGHVASLVALNNLAGSFVHNYNMIILVDDLH